MVAAFFGVVMIGFSALSFLNGKAWMSIAFLPAAGLLLGGGFKELKKSLSPNELTIDEAGIHLRELGVWSHWGWDEYLGVICNNRAITQYRFYDLKIFQGEKRWKLVTIGPFPKDMAHAVRDFVTAIGKSVPLFPDPYFR